MPALQQAKRADSVKRVDSVKQINTDNSSKLEKLSRDDSTNSSVSFFSKLGSVFSVGSFGSKPKAQSADALSPSKKAPRTKQFNTEKGVVKKQQAPLNVMAQLEIKEEKAQKKKQAKEVVKEEDRWKTVAEAIPMKKSEADKYRREELWEAWDTEQSGKLSLYEINKGIKNTPELRPLHQVKAAMMKAYNALRGLRPARKGSFEDDMVSKGDFRWWLLYMKLFYGLHCRMHIHGSGRERMIGQFEFRELAPSQAEKEKLERDVGGWGSDTEWGCSLKEIYCPIADNPDETFEQIDGAQSGEISFEDLCLWAMEHAPSLLDDDDKNRAFVLRQRKVAADAALQAQEDVGLLVFDEGEMVDLDCRWKAVGEAIPIQKNDVDEARREELFVKGGDDAGKGVLSLAEVSDAFRATKGLADLSKCKPALIRAFNAAKGFEPSREGSMERDFVNKLEFRSMLVFLKLYYGLYNRFMIFDESEVFDESEFRAVAPSLREWYCPIDEDPFATFDDIDEHGSGEITFNQLCAWAVEHTTLLSEVDRRAVSTSDMGARASIEQLPMTFEPARGRDLSPRKAKGRDASPGAKPGASPRRDRDASPGRRERLARNGNAVGKDTLREGGKPEGPAGHVPKPPLPKFGRTKSEAARRAAHEETDPHGSAAAQVRASVVGIPGGHAAQRAAMRAMEDAMIRERDQITNGGNAAPAGKAAVNKPKPFLKRADKVEAPVVERERVVAEKAKWKGAAERVPVGRSEEQARRRGDLFRKWDANASGRLSLAEIANALKATKGLEELHKSRGALVCAFNAVKGLMLAREGSLEEDCVSVAEFRMLLVYLKLFVGLLHIFHAADAVSGKTISRQDFRAAAPSLRNWFCPVKKSADETFDDVDVSGKGAVGLDEVCEWAAACSSIISREEAQGERIAAAEAERERAARDKAVPPAKPALDVELPGLEGPNLKVPENLEGGNVDVEQMRVAMANGTMRLSKRDLYVGKTLTPKLKNRPLGLWDSRRKFDLSVTSADLEAVR